jgi:polysaccharide biosynthesis/export protein
MRKNFTLAAILLALWVCTAGAQGPSYLVGEGDILRISVYDHPDLNTQARINSDGTIALPLIGQIQIGGLDVNQVAAAIAEGLADGYVVAPQVSVFIEEFHSKRAVIMGQVKNPGLYELPGATTLLELISKAGGLTDEADQTVTITRRAPEGTEQTLQVNLQEALAPGEGVQTITVMDGDNILVNQAGLYYVSGEVNRPDAYRLEQGTTVLTAITRAGGFTAAAAKRKVRIIRMVDGQERVLKKVPMHAPIEVNDVIVVPASFF